MMDPEGKTLTMHFLNATVVFDADEHTLTVFSRTQGASQEITVNLTEGAIRSLATALTDGVSNAEQRKMARVRQAEEAILQKRADQDKAFMVFHSETPQGSSSIVVATEFIHRRTCTMVPPLAKEATSYDVKALVAKHAGNIVHGLDFCRNCFSRDEEYRGPGLFSSPVTAGSEINAALDKLEAEHVQAARAARGELAGLQGRGTELDDSLDETVVGHDGKYLATTAPDKRSKVQASVFDTLDEELLDAGDEQIDESEKA
jgi:hypothetical protein